MAYESTTVAVDRSQAAIRQLLLKHGAERFAFREGSGHDGRQWAGIEFVHGGHMVRMQVPLKDVDDGEVRRRQQRARTKTAATIRADLVEQEARRIWRVMHWSLKARLEAVQEAVETFEQAFLAHLVDPSSGGTVWQMVAPAIESGAFQIGGEGLKALGSGEP